MAGEIEQTPAASEMGNPYDEKECNALGEFRADWYNVARRMGYSVIIVG